ncbi:unnamed protein product [Cuscuta campestris]|uniref:F-box domain-containing protein n=1 Tax=Cuscuta campestris TaxID=132261 RepID=A0A484L5Y2_9ASTE|nr:unnamed protein product [Cuscuta campestris]
MRPYLPPEVITLILIRLPVKSAVKCTAVCKSWYTLIKDPSFISTHLQQAAALQDDYLLLLGLCGSTLRMVYRLYQENDAFEEYKQQGRYKAAIGFGYDSESDDYKVVFLKGALHWPGYMNDDMFTHMILAYDLSAEKFHVLNYPETLKNHVHELRLTKYGESIAVVATGIFEVLGEEQLELWVMKEYGEDSSWMKVLHSTGENGEFVYDSHVFYELGVRKNGELLLLVRGDRGYDFWLAALDLNCHTPNQQLKCLVGDIDIYASYFGSNVESLVLLDNGEEDTNDPKLAVSSNWLQFLQLMVPLWLDGLWEVPGGCATSEVAEVAGIEENPLASPGRGGNLAIPAGDEQQVEARKETGARNDCHTSVDLCFLQIPSRKTANKLLNWMHQL